MPSIVQRLRERGTRFTQPGAIEPSEPKPAWATNCLNCGAPLTSAFCADCGQRVVPPHPTMGELAGDAFAELSGWDGKFIETFRLLLRKPGELTRRFIEGQRVRFISPVRLYLTISLVYFVVASAAPMFGAGEFEMTGAGVNIKLTDDSKTPPRQTPAGAVIASEQGTISKAARDSALASIAKAPRLVKPILRHVIENPNGFKASLYGNMPRAMFLLVPVFAAVLGLFYRRRNYPEHLYFALHLHAFAFLILLVAELAKFTSVVILYATLAGIAQIAIPVYGFLALRRVYGGTVGTTLLKALGAGLIYMMAYGATIFGVLYWTATSAA